jgi:hypothetical protein
MQTDAKLHKPQTKFQILHKITFTMPPLCSMRDNISNRIDDEDIPLVAFSNSSLIPLHKQQEESPSNAARKRSLPFPTVMSTKKVTFGTSNLSVAIPDKADMTPDEIQSTWWSRGELKSIKHDCIVAIQMMITYGSIDLATLGNTDCCLRGLEGHLPKRRHEKSCKRDKLYRVILGEQWYQYQLMGFICYPEEIAREYEMISHKSARQAHRLGLKDQIEARNCYVAYNDI